MNDEELKNHKALQPVYAKAMGPWQEGDRCCYLTGFPDSLPEYGFVAGINPYNGVLIIRYDDDQTGVFDVTSYDRLLRIPLPIDPRNPERGLWGMIDWSRWRDKGISPNGYYLWLSRIVSVCGPDILDTPVLALLKALAAQWEVTV
jgi:hypothetical protein